LNIVINLVLIVYSLIHDQSSVFNFKPQPTKQAVHGLT